MQALPPERQKRFFLKGHGRNAGSCRVIEPLRKLLELRRQLSDLRGSLQGNDKLEEILQATLHDQEALGRLQQELEPQEAAHVD